jgi:nucleoside 2-deoxyribosyltransferase
MLVEQTTKTVIDVPVAPCVKCGSNDINIHDKGYNHPNIGGGACKSCKHEVLANCAWDVTPQVLIAIWNKKNDITTLIAEQQAIIDSAQAEINALLLKRGGEEQVYLAGPDVFRQDGVARGEYLKALCAEHGMTGLYPFDNAYPEGLDGPAAAKVISQANMDMIRNCTAVMINLNHFRGKEPDSGTAFEFGMAVGLGKKVWAYFENEGTLLQQVPNNNGVDEDGMNVEDFGLPRNLMMACTWLGHSNTAEEAAKALGEATNS